MAIKKTPRRTAQRILETSLTLFNRFGEPGVSTSAISAELNISPGNLYYHFPAKDDLVNALFSRYEEALHPILEAADSVADIEEAWFFMHSVFEVNWQYRFVFRNLNELLSRNRRLEEGVRQVIEDTTTAMYRLLCAMQRQNSLEPGPEGWQPLATSMVILQTYWLSYEYVRNPRQAMEDLNAQVAALRSAAHVLALLAPYVVNAQRPYLERLMGEYGRLETITT